MYISSIGIIPQCKIKSREGALNTRTGIYSSSVNCLNADSVTFGNAKFKDHLEASYHADATRLERIATTYIDTLESVASRLKDYGFSIDREYCEAHSIKSPKSSIEKIEKKKSLDIKDRVRATIYCKDIRNLSILVNKFLPEMEKRGYVLSSDKVSIKDLIKRGYNPTPEELKNKNKTKLIPDLDIRLDHVRDQIDTLPDNLRLSISKPQKSGYHDIQMRFVRNFASNKNKRVELELIILPGEANKDAKLEEYDTVYKHTRLFDALHLKLSDNSPIGSSTNKAAGFISIIKTMFQQEVSQKLYQNAEVKDIYDIDAKLKIFFNENQISLFDNCFSELKRTVKNIYAEKMKSASPEKRAILKQEQKEDILRLNNIQKELSYTMQFYNNKDISEKFSEETFNKEKEIYLKKLNHTQNQQSSQDTKVKKTPRARKNKSI